MTAAEKDPKVWWDRQFERRGIPPKSSRRCVRVIRERRFPLARRVVIESGCLAWESKQDFDRRMALATGAGNGEC